MGRTNSENGRARQGGPGLRLAPLLVPAACVAATWLAGACAAPEPVPGPAPDHTPVAPAPAPRLAASPQESGPPRPVPTEGSDWVRLVSDEWLRGELGSLLRKDLEFDSDKLDDLVLELEDVAEILTVRVFTVLLDDRHTLVGVPHLDGDTFSIATAEGEVRVPRRDVVSFEGGRPAEANYWSGKIKLSGTVRKGNTDQVDTVVSLSTERRTARSRLKVDFDSVVGSLDGTESVNNQTVLGGYDYFLSRRVFLRPLAIEVFRDRFQNIGLRVGPFAGGGYTFVDDGRTEWNGVAGAGYRYTRFDSVAAGEPDTRETVTAVLQTTLESELTDDIELETSYRAEVSLEDAADTNQEATLGLSFEFLWDLDLDVELVWKRVGDPAPDEGGVVPERDDVRLQAGLSWEF